LLLLGLFALLMIIASWSMIRGRRNIHPEGHEFKIPLLIFEGLIIGFLTGLVGAGGGFLIIPALVWLTGLQFKTAVGTSLFIIAINSLFGFFGDMLNYEIQWGFLLILTALAVSGIFIGHQLQKKIRGEILKTMFGWLIFMMGISILFTELLNSIQW
jgi:uncharacterized membrane protein YfcA